MMHCSEPRCVHLQAYSAGNQGQWRHQDKTVGTQDRTFRFICFVDSFLISSNRNVLHVWESSKPFRMACSVPLDSFTCSFEIVSSGAGSCMYLE